MSAGSNNLQGYATYRQIVYWWLIYMVMDVLIWNIIRHLHAVYIANLPRQNLLDFSEIWVFVLLGLFGKMAILQFPFILLMACVFRKKLMLVTSYWVWLPIVAFFASYTLIVGNILITFRPGSVREAWQLITKEWVNYTEPTHMLIPIALLSTLIATVPWMLFLKRKFKH